MGGTFKFEDLYLLYFNQSNLRRVYNQHRISIRNPETYNTKVLTSEIFFSMLLRNVGDSFISLKGSVYEK